ncbi:MAG: hypothetical protein MK188_06865 [Gammaproteobacteria bacterium]|nr:hypothetical protein [Gammaproteobacteria bacterium]
MKLTQQVIELMFELSSIDGIDSNKYLNSNGDQLRSNLLNLFNTTENTQAHEIIINIFSEAGCPWFGTIARGEGFAYEELVKVAEIQEEGKLMSDDAFMELLPANGRIH